MSRVSIVSCGKYDSSLVREALLEIIKNTAFPKVQGKKVLLKTNILSDSSPDRHITTNPLVVKELAIIIKELGAEAVYIGDSPGIPGPTFRGEGCGIADVCRETGSIWADFSEKSETRKLWQNIQVPIASIVLSSDVVISVAKMKTHQLMYTTGAVKNMFGVIPGLHKSPLHLRARSPENFAKFILSLYNEVKPDYAIMDGIIAMEGAGPANGTPRQVGLLLGSENAVSLDYAQATIMGYKTSDIPIIKEALRRDRSSARIEYPSLNAEDLIIEDFRRIPVSKKGLFSSLILPFFSRSLDRKKAAKRTAPLFDHERCKRCRKCIEICPANALAIKDKKIAIEEDKCIRCYCCHEMCPFDAIKID